MLLPLQTVEAEMVRWCKVARAADVPCHPTTAIRDALMPTEHRVRNSLRPSVRPHMRKPVVLVEYYVFSLDMPRWTVGTSAGRAWPRPVITHPGWTGPERGGAS